jgi:hypothetical protein
MSLRLPRCEQLYSDARRIDRRNVDASVGLGQLLKEADPMKAVREMAHFPDPQGCGEPAGTYGRATFDDSFVHIEIARTLIKHATVRCFHGPVLNAVNIFESWWWEG